MEEKEEKRKTEQKEEIKERTKKCRISGKKKWTKEEEYKKKCDS